LYLSLWQIVPEVVLEYRSKLDTNALLLLVTRNVLTIEPNDTYTLHLSWMTKNTPHIYIRDRSVLFCRQTKNYSLLCVHYRL
jgi:hypothetical protein